MHFLTGNEPFPLRKLQKKVIVCFTYRTSCSTLSGCAADSAAQSLALEPASSSSEKTGCATSSLDVALIDSKFDRKLRRRVKAHLLLPGELLLSGGARAGRLLPLALRPCAGGRRLKTKSSMSETIFQNFEIRAAQKCAYLVDLEKC